MCSDNVHLFSRQIAAGGCLFIEGDAISHVYELLTGLVVLSKSLPDGRRQIVGFIRAGEPLFPGCLPPRNGAYANCTAQAATPTRVLEYGSGNFDDMIRSNPGLLEKMLSTMSYRLHIAQEHMLLLGRMTVVERFAWFLFTLAREGDELCRTTISLPACRYDIADYLGVAVETVSRCIGALRRQRVIEIASPAEVRILNWQRLSELAGAKPS